jgi:signal transduction histidine kinase
MKIGQRLALRFTLVSALLTGTILIFIFVVTRRYVHEDFVERLIKQSSLEVLHFATPHVKDVISQGSFLLINPMTSIYAENGQLLYESGHYPGHSRWIKNVRGDEVFRMEEGSYTTIGRKYTVGGKTYLVFISDNDLPGQHELDIFMKAIFFGWLVSIGLSYIAGLYFSGNALKPVKLVVSEVTQITKDNLSYRLTTKASTIKPDEIEELVITFNALLDRIEHAFVAQKRFVQHASHEIKTPLTAIMGEAELALVKDRTPEEYRRTLLVVVSETERLVNITQGLLTLARFEEGYYSTELENVNLIEIIENAEQAFKLRYPERKLVTVSAGEGFFLRGNAQLLQIALYNLIDNAFKYSNAEVELIISKTQSDFIISISDKGIGIPDSDLPKIKSPMFRGANVKSIPGAGLGLSLVHRIIEFHKGGVEIRSKLNKGTTSQIHIPRSTDNPLN